MSKPKRRKIMTVFPRQLMSFSYDPTSPFHIDGLSLCIFNYMQISPLQLFQCHIVSNYLEFVRDDWSSEEKDAYGFVSQVQKLYLKTKLYQSYTRYEIEQNMLANLLYGRGTFYIQNWIKHGDDLWIENTNKYISLLTKASKESKRRVRLSFDGKSEKKLPDIIFDNRFPNSGITHKYEEVPCGLKMTFFRGPFKVGYGIFHSNPSTFNRIKYCSQLANDDILWDYITRITWKYY